jgi:5S rRNA maturation endonuclease (ribonuclease M5)
MTDLALMTKKSETKKYRSYNQDDLKKIGDLVCDNIENLLDLYKIEYRQTTKMIISQCPIHGGDNCSALNIYPYGETYRGNWKCRTHHCEELFMSSIVGFVRGLLSHSKYGWTKKGDTMVSFNDTMVFIEKFLNIKESDWDTTNSTLSIKSIPQKPKKNLKIEQPIENSVKNYISRTSVRKLLKIPATYYIERGYTESILNRYDVGLCLTKGKEMYGRIVVPVYDNEYKHMIGCTGRSIFAKCDACKCYHNSSYRCPDKINQWKYSKWKHSFGFKSQANLYNYWFAKKHIEQTGMAILVEGPGNVWKLEENGIHNSVAMFGSNLSDKQLSLLNEAKTNTIIVLTDSDDAGQQAKKNIITKCENIYKIFSPHITKNDVGDMTTDEIQIQIIDFIHKIK